MSHPTKNSCILSLTDATQNQGSTCSMLQLLAGSNPYLAAPSTLSTSNASDQHMQATQEAAPSHSCESCWSSDMHTNTSGVKVNIMDRSNQSMP